MFYLSTSITQQKCGSWSLTGWPCGGLEMAPHVNKWSTIDGAHE